MDTLVLPGGTTATSRIGMGCGRLNGGAAVRESAKLVEAALACGIRHFDVAPSYGLGLAEGVLGRVVGDSPNVTITTKTGIAAPRHGQALSLVRTLVKPLVARLPAMRARLASGIAAPATSYGRFALDDMRASVEASRKALRRDRIDLLLLHEPPPAPGPEVEAALKDFLDQELIAAYGVGTGAGPAALPPFGSTTQFLWTPDDSSSVDGRLSIRHGLMRSGLARLHAVIDAGAIDRAAVSAATGFNLDDRALTPAFLLTVVLSLDPSGMVLISSNDPKRITTAVHGVDWAFAGGKNAAFNQARDGLLDAMVRTADPAAVAHV